MKITHSVPLIYPDLPGVQVYSKSGDLNRGRAQEVLVCVPRSSVIPLHTHSVDAEMFVVSGKATVLREEGDGEEVGIGTNVFFPADVPHGFRTEEGFSFLSKNGGIVDQNKPWDLQF